MTTKPKQPKDPFDGAGDFVPKKPKNGAAAQAALREIITFTEAARARVDVMGVGAARLDLAWIKQVAENGLKAR